MHLERGVYMPFDMMKHAKRHPTKARAARAGSKPAIDGRLDEVLWQGKPTIGNLSPMRAEGSSSVKTKVWMSRDDAFLFVGVRCDEPQPDYIRSEIEERDGEVWTDDSIEIVLDTNRDQKTYYRFAVNSNGVLYESRGVFVVWKHPPVGCRLTTNRHSYATGRKQFLWDAEVMCCFV